MSWCYNLLNHCSVVGYFKCFCIFPIKNNPWDSLQVSQLALFFRSPSSRPWPPCHGHFCEEISPKPSTVVEANSLHLLRCYLCCASRQVPSALGKLSCPCKWTTHSSCFFPVQQVLAMPFWNSAQLPGPEVGT